MSIPIVALHYWAGAGRAFELVRGQLPAGQRLLAPDLPGFGAQVPPAGTAPEGFDFSVRSYADWLGAYLARQRVSDYVLVGHSMGGKIALAWAGRQPAGLRGLLLLSPSPPGPEPMTEESRAAALAAYGRPTEAENTLAFITAAPLPARVRQAVLEDNLRASRPAWNACLQRGPREDITARLPPPLVPCPLLVGAADRAITPLTQRQQTLPHLPAHTQLEEVPATGHLLPLEAPAVVAAALLDLSQPGTNAPVADSAGM